MASGKLLKSSSIICKEVFDDGYQPSSDGKYILFLYSDFVEEIFNLGKLIDIRKSERNIII